MIMDHPYCYELSYLMWMLFVLTIHHYLLIQYNNVSPSRFICVVHNSIVEVCPAYVPLVTLSQQLNKENSLKMYVLYAFTFTEHYKTEHLSVCIPWWCNCIFPVSGINFTQSIVSLCLFMCETSKTVSLSVLLSQLSHTEVTEKFIIDKHTITPTNYTTIGRASLSSTTKPLLDKHTRTAPCIKDAILSRSIISAASRLASYLIPKVLKYD